MVRSNQTFRSLGLLVLAAGVLLSCALPQSVTVDVGAGATATQIPPTPAPPTAAPPATPTETAPAEPPTEPSATESGATLHVVAVLAASGNLNLRRGPGQAYNIVGNLLQGEQSAAMARNQGADWLMVTLPNDPSKSGWVSAVNPYVQVSAEAGAVQALEVREVDAAKPAYLRNCTFHPMLIQPANLLLKEKSNAPDNMKQFNPGVYEAYDQNQEGHPKVFSAELREGRTLDITKDGLGMTYLCP